MNNTTILQKIIIDKKNWINIQTKKMPLKILQSNVQLSRRNFYKALNKKHTVFILECKKASPSQGIICKNFDVVKIANIYKRYAAAISVLTDEKYFLGNFNFLDQVSKTVTQPILCKDFIISTWQIYFSRLHQADAVLLMLSILDDSSYKKLTKVASNLHMEVLTEVSNEQEWNRAINLGAKIIGINNRNLHNLNIDLTRTITLSKNKPKDTIIISESGINHHREVRQLSQYVNGFLIGGGLTKEQNINIAVNRILLGENKVCGLTRASDAQTAYQVGAIYGGLIFVPRSPRYINLNTAYKIISNTQLLNYVGIFRDAPIEHIIKVVKLLDLSTIQLHGNENHEYIKKLYNILTRKCSIWKAYNANQYVLHPHNNTCLKEIKRYVLDNEKGGSGKTFDWSILNTLTLSNIILSGGLTIKNCHAAAQLGCAGLDFNSGVEISPGIKDHYKLNKIFQILRSY